MSTAPTANVRVLELFVELLGARPGRTKAQLRSLPGYRGLADDALETQFQRDKDALREAGAHLSIGRGERYSIARDSFAPDIEVTSVDRVLLSLAARAWDREDIVADSIDAKAAAASDEDVSAPAIRLGLRGLEAATSFARAIRERRVVTFEYPGSGDLTERAVEPWALSVQGRALYLWGWDLDRGAERTFRVSRVRSAVEFLGEEGDASPAPARVAPRVSSLVSPLVRIRRGSAARSVLAGYEALDERAANVRTREGWEPVSLEDGEIGTWIARLLPLASAPTRCARRCSTACDRLRPGEETMPETVSLAIVRLSSMIAWIAEHPGVHVDELCAHFGRTRRQVRRDIEYVASVGDSLPGQSFEVDWGLFEEEQRVSLRATLGASAPLRLSEVEAQALLIGLSAIGPLLAPDVAAHLPHAALVVSALGGLQEAGAQGHIDASPVPASSAVAEALREALARSQRVSFDYVSAQGRSSHRVVDPWSLEASSTGWLLRGWCTQAEGPRTFSLASMSNVGVVGPRVHSPRRVRDDAPTWTLDVDRDARWIADEYDVRIACELPDGGARIRVPVWNEEWGLSLLTDVAAHLRAVTPDHRAQAGARARSIITEWSREEES